MYKPEFNSEMAEAIENSVGLLVQFITISLKMGQVNANPASPSLRM